MTVTIDFAPDDEQKLVRRAAASGQDVVTYICRLVKRDIESPPSPASNQATLDLLARWDREDETDDPAEIERRRREWEELKLNLNRSREETGSRTLFP